jgi:hypothetical protein
MAESLPLKGDLSGFYRGLHTWLAIPIEKPPFDQSSVTSTIFFEDLHPAVPVSGRTTTLAQISIARHISPYEKLPEGFTQPSQEWGIDYGGRLEAYIAEWGERAPGANSNTVHNFAPRGEPSVWDMDNCVWITFRLDAYNRSGIATAYALRWSF